MIVPQEYVKISDCPDGFTFVAFNQDSSCFLATTNAGCNIFTTDPLRKIKDSCVHEPLVDEATGKSLDSEPFGGCTRAEMLYRCNFLAVVKEGQPDVVHIWDDVRRKFILQLEMNGPVLAIRLRRDRIVVVQEKMVKESGFKVIGKVYTFTKYPQQEQEEAVSLFSYDIRTTQHKLHIFDTFPNPKGLCALSADPEKAILAYPMPGAKQGNVKIINLADPDRDLPNCIDAHEGALQCMAINTSGTLLATASEKGTLIRIFSTDTGELFSEVRRGTQPVKIYSINFNADSSLLCAVSNNRTLHIFSVEKSSNTTESSGIFGTISSMTGFSTSSSFCKIRISESNPILCAFSSSPNSVIAICAEGSYQKFKFDRTGSSDVESYQMFLDKG